MNPKSEILSKPIYLIEEPDKTLKPYQIKAIKFQCQRPHSMLWLDMGLGKTVSTLTSVLALIAYGKLRGVLIVAPIRVVHLVWKQECEKWSHLKGNLTFSSIMGSRDQRSRALLRPADVYLTNYENLLWLSQVCKKFFIDKGKPLPFDGIVWDEISKMKNSMTVRVRAFKKIMPHFVWATGLTGTPASNGYKDLHGQYLVVDGGKRLGEGKTQFRERFMVKDGPYNLKLQEGAQEQIKRLIGDMTLEMSAEDYNPLPDMIMNDVYVELESDLRTKYDELEKQFFTTINDTDISAFNNAALTNKCLQFSNGAVYPSPDSTFYENVHDLKLDALGEILEEANGKPVLLAYAYKSDAARILERFKEYAPINLTGNSSPKFLNDAIKKWNDGTCRLIIGHPASMGHGIDDLKNNGNILVWFGLNWSSDLYKQFNSRLRRQGQKSVVFCHRILTRDTLDDVQRLRLADKDETEEGLKKVIREYGKTRGYY